ncbi:MAG: signal peptidase II [Limisphaerales bacterium]
MSALFQKSNQRIAALALVILALDQWSKWFLLRSLGDFPDDEKVIIPGFFKFVHWGNTGAAWSLFSGNNGVLALVALVALVLLFFTRHHFESHTWLGQIAYGLIFGGIAGNLVDRLHRHEVVDFIRFFMVQRGGGEIGFPAFNLADSAICTGVGLIFLITWKNEQTPKKPAESS